MDIETEAKRVALDMYPENWQNEYDSHAIQPKQIDYNKTERLVFEKGYILAFSSINEALKNNLSIELSEEQTYDFGRTYNSIEAIVYFGGEKVCSSSVSI